MHEHGYTHIVHQAQPVSKQSVPQLKDGGKGKLTTKQEADPPTGQTEETRYQCVCVCHNLSTNVCVSQAHMP